MTGMSESRVQYFVKGKRPDDGFLLPPCHSQTWRSCSRKKKANEKAEPKKLHGSCVSAAPSTCSLVQHEGVCPESAVCPFSASFLQRVPLPGSLLG